ncbi:MAG: glycosyltransferase [Pseudomonadota bacterium]
MLVNNGLAAGGAERQIVYTLKGLRARGVEAVFVGEYLHRAAGLDFHLHSLRDAGVDVQGLERATQPGPALFQHVTPPVASLLSQAPAAMMLEILDMVAILRAQTPAVVHLWQDETSIKHGLAALIAGAPRIVLSGRNLNPTHFEYFAPHMRAAYLALLSDPRVVMSNNSRAGARSYAEWLGVDEKRIVVSHNAVDPSDWPDPPASVRANVRARFAIDDAAPVVAGVFRLSLEKRPLLWIETARALRTRLPDAAFFVLGDGPMKAQFLAKAEALQLGGALHYLGERNDVHDILAASDLFLLTSAQEGTPNALLEAQWAGLACVSTDAGGAGEALAEGETGLIVSDATPAALAAALCKLWDDQDLRLRARRSGRAFVSDRFSLDRMIENTFRLYGLA